MLRMLIDRLLWVVLGCSIVFAAAHSVRPEPKPLLIHADYQRCISVRPAPLEPRRGIQLYPNLKDVA
jgi:hypothetical protein